MKWIKKTAETPLTSIAKVIDSIVPSTNDRRNAPSIHAVRQGIANMWEVAYPVGAIYISTNATDPSVLFGGTWNRITDRFLLASGSTYSAGQTGGAAEHSFIPNGTIGGHAITVPELPEHIHPIKDYWYPDEYAAPLNPHYDVQSGTDVDIPKVVKNAGYSDLVYTGYNSMFLPSTYSTDKTQRAEGAAHSHDFTGQTTTTDTMPPYLTVYIWERTA